MYLSRGYGGTGQICVNINECNYPNPVCGTNELCLDTEGSYECIETCPDNTVLVGPTVFNDCLENNGDCGDHRECSVTTGAVVCGDCESGYAAQMMTVSMSMNVPRIRPHAMRMPYVATQMAAIPVPAMKATMVMAPYAPILTTVPQSLATMAGRVLMVSIHLPAIVPSHSNQLENACDSADDCNNHGTCVAQSDGNICECEEAYSGIDQGDI